MDDPAAVLDRVAPPGREQRLDDEVGARAAIGPAPVKRVILLRSVPLPEHEAEPAPAREVEDRDVLGQSDRIVQRPEWLSADW